MPSVPAPADDVKTGETKKLKRGVRKRPTLLTGPRGVTEAAPVELKTLLGE